ncbi:transposase [Arthrobacter sp. UYCo732]|uniref:transposase n=1 Tax=Arthrobacter sp. UYCo732 TaxID=3156336 RepID=UPI0033924311
MAGQFLVEFGDNTAASATRPLAKLCGVAPQPASSGRRPGPHRPFRSGDRAAKSALCIIAIVRMHRHEPTRN